MRFVKMQATGNDFICINCFQEKIAHPHQMARRLCDRHRGIGADGLLLLLPSDCADCRMELYNQDGSTAGMCGNGIRCVGAYLNQYLLPDRKELLIETGSGLKRLWKIGDNWRVDMEEPRFEAKALPVLSEKSLVVEEYFEAAGTMVRLTCVSMGNPHAVCFLEAEDSVKPEVLGPALEHHHRFPEGVNVEFVRILDWDRLRVRVWERGCGETLACGTGACAAAAAGVLTGRCGRQVFVDLPGGCLEVVWKKDAHMFLEGPACRVFSGEWEALE